MESFQPTHLPFCSGIKDLTDSGEGKWDRSKEKGARREIRRTGTLKILGENRKQYKEKNEEKEGVVEERTGR